MAPSESLQNAEFENALKALLENPCDENLDLINKVRANFVRSSETAKDIIEKLQSLTWTIVKPTSDELDSIANIISLGRQLLKSTASLIASYQPLWQKGVIITETSEFRDVINHLAEVLDEIELVYFTGSSSNSAK